VPQPARSLHPDVQNVFAGLEVADEVIEQSG
jgi:hypothetical protein